MEPFLAPQSWPFTVALMLLVSIGVIEGLALLVGVSISGWLDHFAPGVEAGPDSWLGWLHLGKVPMLVLLVVLLTAFALIGYTVNGVSYALLGSYPPTALSAAAALFGALPVVRVAGGAIARLVPRDETFAVPLASLVGRVAVVVNGTARIHYPAQARVTNEHGRTLYVHVEPDAEDVQFGAGDSVLLVKQISGSRFAAIVNPRPDLL
jgi:hypothetical protein